MENIKKALDENLCASAKEAMEDWLNNKDIGDGSRERAERLEVALQGCSDEIAKEILKDCNLYKNAPTLIACPTCGRIQYDLIPIANEIEEFLQTIKAPITVAVMGCGVNGPNEARHADIGIAGGIKEGLLFKKGEIVRKISEDKLVQELMKEIELFEDKKEGK